MKIGNPLDLIRSNQPASGGAALAAEKTKADAGLAPAADSGNSASVKISSGLAALAAETSDSDAFDAKRVEQLKAAIDNGTFKVNAETVADKVISSNLEALSRGKP